MSPIPQKIQRIRAELKQVGITSYGLSRFASKYLPFILDDEEHIEGAVYGRYNESRRTLASTEGMLVATNYRVLFLQRTPPASETMDELAYASVQGVSKSMIRPFLSVTLKTTFGNYTLRAPNLRCVVIFAHTIERYCAR